MKKPNPEEIAAWQRRLASQANNRAWTLAETTHRSSDEDDEMLQAAHAAMYFWKIVGTVDHHARAALLLAHVYALLGQSTPAAHYLKKSLPHFMHPDAPAGEVAFAHAVAANVASVEGNMTEYAKHCSEAASAASRMKDPETIESFAATFRVVSRSKA